MANDGKHRQLVWVPDGRNGVKPVMKVCEPPKIDWDKRNKEATKNFVKRRLGDGSWDEGIRNPVTGEIRWNSERNK